MSVSLVCLSYFLFFISNAQCLSEVKGCTERFMELPLVSKRAEQIGRKVAPNGPLSGELRVLRDLYFNCSTNITSLILGIDVREATVNRTLFPSIQLFRRNTSNNIYSLVAGSEKAIYYSTSNVSTSGVFEYPLDPPISVQSGDNLAVSQPDENESIVVIHYINNVNWNTVRYDIGTTSFAMAELQINQQLVLVYPITDTPCIVSSVSTVNETTFRSYSLQINKVSPLMMQRQIIYPEIEFYCNGSITKWIYGATINDSNTQQPELQIWRPTSPSNYMKVGSRSIKMSNSTIYGSNVFEFIPKSPLSFQEGDIFGVFNPPNTKVNLHEQLENGPLNLIQATSLYSAPSTFTSQLATVKLNFPLVTLEIEVDATSSPIQDKTSFSSSAPITFSSVYFTIQSIIQSASIASTFSTAMSTESINNQSTQSPISFTRSPISQTSVTHTSSIRRSISQSDSVSVSSTSGILISSSASITGSSTSNPLENSLPAIVGGLVGVIVILLLLLALCAIVVFAMMFRSKKKKVVAFGNNRIEAQYEEVGPRNELSFRNELYNSVESQGEFPVPAQYDKLNFIASSDTNQNTIGDDNVPFYADISQSHIDGPIDTMKNLAYREVNYDEDSDMIDNPLYESEKHQMN